MNDKIICSVLAFYSGLITCLGLYGMLKTTDCYKEGTIAFIIGLYLINALAIYKLQKRINDFDKGAEE